MSRPRRTIINSWPTWTRRSKRRRRPNQRLPPLLFRHSRLANRQNLSRNGRSDLAEDMVEQQAASGGERNARAVAHQIARPDKPIDASPVHRCRQAEPLADGFVI